MTAFLRAFFAVDKERKEMITTDDLRSFMLENNFEEGFVDTWVKNFDKDGDGEITLEEYCNKLGLKLEVAKNLRKQYDTEDRQGGGDLSDTDTDETSEEDDELNANSPPSHNTPNISYPVAVDNNSYQSSKSGGLSLPGQGDDVMVMEQTAGVQNDPTSYENRYSQPSTPASSGIKAGLSGDLAGPDDDLMLGPDVREMEQAGNPDAKLDAVDAAPPREPFDDLGGREVGLPRDNRQQQQRQEPQKERQHHGDLPDDVKILQSDMDWDTQWECVDTCCGVIRSKAGNGPLSGDIAKEIKEKLDEDWNGKWNVVLGRGMFVLHCSSAEGCSLQFKFRDRFVLLWCATY